MSLARYLANLLNSSGQVPDAKLVALTASKLSGQVPDANAPSGSVIQVVQNALTQQVNTTSTTDTTVISQSITPSSASSKIWVFATCPTLTGSNVETWFSLYRDSTQIVAEDKHGSTGGSSIWLPVALQRLDAPNTTSAITYSLRFRSHLAGTITYAGTGSSGTNNTQITLMEIAA